METTASTRPETRAARLPSVRVLLVATAIGAAVGLVAGWWTPRGPVSSGEALGAMAMAAVAGGAAGALTRSRWSMSVTPLVFVAMFELVRSGASGPTVDSIVLSNTYGVVAFATGRLLHGVLALGPMVVGASLGRAWRLRYDGRRSIPPHEVAVGRPTSRVLVAVAGAGLVLLAIGLLRPASTDAIVDADGEPLAGSIAEIERVGIGGHQQTLLIRGNDSTSPVLLFLAGGPGGSELGTMRRWGGLLERDFVVVTWDQLGAGSSSGQFEPSEVLTFPAAIEDVIAVTEHLQDRFGVEQVYLVGNSYGTLLGVRAVQERPDLYAAFVGSGQMVDVVETDRRFYHDALAHAEATGDGALADTLRANGPPPYEDLLKMAPIVASERSWNDYRDIEGFPGLREPTENLFVTEYTLMDQLRSLAALVDSYAVLYPQLEELDLRVDATRLEVPVYLVQGAHEARGRAEPAAEWFDLLDAPHKEWITFERSGHRPWVQEPERFHQVMGDVRADTAPERSTTVVAGDAPAGELLALFRDYNPSVWPVHLIAYGLGLAVVLAVWRRPGSETDRFVALVLAAMWAWMGVVFHGRFAAQLEPLTAAVYGASFVLQAGLLVRAGFVRRDLSFVAGSGPAARFGWAAIAYALVAYPLVGLASGHGWPQSPLFGVAPCPTTIATFGLLLLARPPVPRSLLWVPLAWAVLAPPVAIGQGVVQDVGLLIVGVAATAVIVWRDHRPRRAATPRWPLEGVGREQRTHGVDRSESGGGGSPEQHHGRLRPEVPELPRQGWVRSPATDT